MKFAACIILLTSVLFFYSCKKESFTTSGDASLQINADTLHFDTVFTTVGSITQSFTIINTNSQKLRLSSIKLSGSSGSPFKINIDGYSSTEVTNIDLAANDSVYVFVTVTINPNNSKLPFIVQDSILIDYNGNERKVQLEAYGQNAHFLRSQLITGNVNWQNDLPYVVIGGLLIDSSATLSIDKGTHIYLHADAPLIVDGTLQTNGTKTDSVVFQGDRLDEGYRDLPASWPGIFFRGSSNNNVLVHTIVKNSYQAIVADAPSSNSNPKVQLKECIVDNAYDIGILGLNSSISAENCLVSNCGSNIILARGGSYQFTHCTVASYGNIYIEHKTPVLYVTNWDSTNNQLLTYDIDASFINCIFWGDNGLVDDEVVVSKKGNNNFSVLFDHDLYKVKNVPVDANLNAMINMEDPLFDSINVNKLYFDFHIGQKPSPAIGAGLITSVTTDLDDKIRPTPPSLGCYEK